MRDHDNVVARATAALAQSVASIVGCDDDDATKAAALTQTFTEFQIYLEKADDDGGDRENGDRNRAGGGGLANHPVVQLARLLVASGKFGDHAEALDHLLNTPRGVALVRTHKAATEKEKPMDRIETIRNIAKTGGGVVVMAKCFLDKGSSFGIGEEEFTRIMTEHAQKLYPDKTPAAAFSKLFSDTGPDGVVLRKAHALTKDATWLDSQPTVISGGDLRDAGDAAAAMDELREIGRRMAPTATPEKQFSVAFEDPKNVTLARRAYSRPTAPLGGVYPMPR
jgi:hypothetical protein